MENTLGAMALQVHQEFLVHKGPSSRSGSTLLLPTKYQFSESIVVAFAERKAPSVKAPSSSCQVPP